MEHEYFESSHELGAELVKLGQEILARPEIKNKTLVYDVAYDVAANKKEILAFAQNLRPVKKEYNDTQIHLFFGSGKLKLAIRGARSTVCTLVTPAKPAVYECEPLLSPEEDAVLGGE